MVSLSTAETPAPDGRLVSDVAGNWMRSICLPVVLKVRLAPCALTGRASKEKARTIKAEVNPRTLNPGMVTPR